MIKVQEFKATYEKGKETQKEKIGKARSFMDSIAESVVFNSSELIKKTIMEKSEKRTIHVFEELKKQKEGETDHNRMKKDDLIVFANSKEIAIDESANKADILKVVNEALKTE